MKHIKNMKAITIMQPWATLIALGEKKFETRGWATKYRGPLAIHAGQKIDREACLSRTINDVLLKHGIISLTDLPTGAIVASSHLSECYKVEYMHNSGIIGLKAENGKFRLWAGARKNEYYFGDYSDGRYAWELANVQALAEPIPAKGMQRLWNWEATA
ncbi:ASCH domain-containing protein [Paenibacillus sp. SER-28]